jgi:hypothetical protein
METMVEVMDHAMTMTMLLKQEHSYPGLMTTTMTTTMSPYCCCCCSSPMAAFFG